MRTRPLGTTGLQVSEIGMGCSGLGGGLHSGDRREALATVQAALDAGVNFFDTSDTYTLGGSERLLGWAFRGRRSRVILATKVGFVYSALGRTMLRMRPLLRPVRGLLRPSRASLNRVRYAHKHLDYSPKHLADGLHGSLRRLRTDYLDLYQLHNPPPEVIARGECFEIMERFRAQGKIRHYGVSCAEVAHAPGCFGRPGIAALQIPVSLLDQEAAERVLPRAARESMGIIARVPLAQGLLTDRRGDSKAEQVVKSAASLAHRQRRAEALRFLATERRTLAQAALQFVLQLPGVSTAIPGISRRGHLEENLRALAAPALTADELRRVAGLGGLPRHPDEAADG